MATDRTAEVTWHGDLMSGSGRIDSVTSGAIGGLDVDWRARSEDAEAKTSPEELIAAAHATCFSMALSHGLGQAGHPAEELKTSATVSFQPGEGITKIALQVTGNVPGMSQDDFRQAAETAKESCPVSKALEGVPELEERSTAIEEELRVALAPTDPADSKDVIVEIRQGVGGDEAAIWAGDLYRALTRYAERRGFRIEQLGASPNDAGGYKEVTFAISGDGAYSVFKWEGGTHRVQRVPETESQGRIHTSTATVAVMPEAEEVEVEIDPNELKVDVYRSTGPGGQSVNTTDSAVRITHLPTGLVVSMQDEKSQLQNRQKALRVLRARLYELEREKQQTELGAARNAQIGSGERAEKIRTYNFPENRLTDHRVKLTVHQLDRILQGELDSFTEALATDERRRALGE